MTLSELKVKQRGNIKSVRVSGPIGERIMAMGIFPNQGIIVERVAPSGEPLWVRVCGSQVALRRSEAECVDVSLEQDSPPDTAERRG